ncbi:MAG: hypothetical protein VX777_08170 [Chlamydiota bacterium]|nr:hypothetical protein [Chlamydiota bacterium]
MNLITAFDSSGCSDLRGTQWDGVKENILKNKVEVLKVIDSKVDSEIVDNIRTVCENTKSNLRELFFYKSDFNYKITGFLDLSSLHTLRLLGSVVQSEDAFNYIEEETGPVDEEKVLEIQSSSLVKGSIDSLITNIAKKNFPVTELRLEDIPQLDEDKLETLTQSLLKNRKIVHLTIGVNTLTVKMAESLANVIEQNKILESLRIKFQTNKAGAFDTLSCSYDKSKRFKKGEVPSKLQLFLEKIDASNINIHLMNIEKSNPKQVMLPEFQGRFEKLEEVTKGNSSRLDSVEKSIANINQKLSKITQNQIEAIRNEIDAKAKSNPKVKVFYNQFFRYFQGKVIGEITNASGTTQAVTHESVKAKVVKIGITAALEAVLLTGATSAGILAPHFLPITIPASIAAIPMVKAAGEHAVNEIMFTVFDEICRSTVSGGIELANEVHDLRKAKQELTRNEELASAEGIEGLTVQELELVYANIAKAMVYLFEDYLQDWSKADGESVCKAFFEGKGVLDPKFFADNKAKITVKEKKYKLSEVFSRCGVKSPGCIRGNVVLADYEIGLWTTKCHLKEFETDVSTYRSLTFKDRKTVSDFFSNKFDYIRRYSPHFIWGTPKLTLSSYAYNSPEQKMPQNVDKAILNFVKNGASKNEPDLRTLLKFQPDLSYCKNLKDIMFAAIDKGDLWVLKFLNTHVQYTGTLMNDKLDVSDLLMRAFYKGGEKTVEYLIHELKSKKNNSPDEINSRLKFNLERIEIKLYNAAKNNDAPRIKQICELAPMLKMRHPIYLLRQSALNCTEDNYELLKKHFFADIDDPDAKRAAIIRESRSYGFVDSNPPPFGFLF